jgi:hypothetical protein
MNAKSPASTPDPSEFVVVQDCINQLQEKLNVCAKQVEHTDAHFTSQMDNLQQWMIEIQDELDSFSEV